MSRALILKRIGWSLLAGIVMGALISELSFFLLDTGQTRAPKMVHLDIPAGTADRVARGQADAQIPANMNFVVGDTLMVSNHDTVAHQLGPLLIPAGAEASMQLRTEEGYTLQCSFQPSKYLALSVLPPLTIWTRVVGILETGINVGILIALYAVFALPYKKKVVDA